MNIGSLASSFMPQMMNMVIGGAMMQNPVSAMAFMGLNSQSMGMLSSFDPMSMESMFKPLETILGIITKLFDGMNGVNTGKVTPQQTENSEVDKANEHQVEHHHRTRLHQNNGVRHRYKRDRTQNAISSILNGSFSMEEKIILIAGVVGDSISNQLDDLMQEQGKMAKKLTQKGGNNGGGAEIQNVENKIQVLMQRLNRMNTMVSNMLQAMHTTKKAMVMNIRV